MKRKKILVFDSGCGGLTTMSEISNRVENCFFIYYADDNNAPFGTKDNNQIINITEKVINLFKRKVDVFVLACNTATGVAIEELRQKHGVLIVGTEPAINPAYEQSNGEKILAVVTPLEAKQKKFQTLIQNKNVCVFSPHKLASKIDKVLLFNESKQLFDYEINSIKQISKSLEIKSIVLGCTHFIFLKHFTNLQNEFAMFDGNIGVANRVVSLLNQKKLNNKTKKKNKFSFVLSSRDKNKTEKFKIIFSQIQKHEIHL